MAHFTFSQKRTCKGCLAKRASLCILGYKFKTAIRKIGIYEIVYSKPLEPCYKPIIHADLKRAKLLIENSKAP